MPQEHGSAIELRHLRYFIAVAEMGSLTEAAKQVHTSLPSLSRQIRDLENQVGVALLSRSVHGVELINEQLPDELSYTQHGRHHRWMRGMLRRARDSHRSTGQGGPAHDSSFALNVISG